MSNVPQKVPSCHHVSILADIDLGIDSKVIAFVSGEILTLRYCVSTSTDHCVTQCCCTRVGRDRAET